MSIARFKYNLAHVLHHCAKFDQPVKCLWGFQQSFGSEWPKYITNFDFSRWTEKVVDFFVIPKMF